MPKSAVRFVPIVMAVGLVVASSAAVHGQSTRYDPRLQFRTLTTERFTIHYHQHEEALARRLARIAADVAAETDARLGTTRGRVHVILVDQTDEPNGWAAVTPYNVIEIAAVPPASYSVIGNTDDWLRMVFAHEYTHVVHLEKSGGWFGSLRHVFGRAPLFYPNLTLPDWQIEGIATYEESALTARGRLAAGDFRMILNGAAAGGRFAPLDRAAAAVIDWPSGNSPYLYGGFFHQYLADKYGRESLARLADETARRLPFFGSRAFRHVYGRSLGALWDDFHADARARTNAGREPDARTRLTRHGFVVTSPHFSRDGRLFYSVATPHAFPALMELRRGAESRRVATKYRGNRLTQAGDMLVFDQLEIVNHVDVQSDLYAVSTTGGDSRRLTREARAADPDAAPDGETIVCTIQETGRRLLATLKMPPPGEVARPVILVSEPAAEFSSPRWSPDGRSIAAERRRLGGPSEIVVIDAATLAVRTIVSSATARNTLPTWLPDGTTILFSSDRDGGPFTLYAADISSGSVRRVAGAGVGAQAAALSPDGSRIVFVGYSVDGYDLYSIPFDTATWERAPAEPGASAGSTSAPPAAAPAAADAVYRPWSTLTPRFWLPVIESDVDDVEVGAATGGSDVLGRHAYWVSGRWALDRQQPDAQLDYVYARWWPTLFGSVSTDADASRFGDFRSREISVGTVLPVRRVRWNSTSMAALFASRETFDCAECSPSVDRTRTRSALRLGWRFSSAKAFGYSISAEEGFSIATSSELTRRSLGADADAGMFTADVRQYLRVVPRHGVIAARVAGASSWGDERMRRLFTAGGSGPTSGGFDFDADAIALLRGFDDSDLFGNHAAVVNLDYRFPISWVQRGVGTLPFFLSRVHGAVFADVGHAWDSDFKAADLRRSFGGELSFDTVLAHSFGLTMTAGAAWRHNPAGEPRGLAFFVRLGRAF